MIFSLLFVYLAAAAAATAAATAGNATTHNNGTIDSTLIRPDIQQFNPQCTRTLETDEEHDPLKNYEIKGGKILNKRSGKSAFVHVALTKDSVKATFRNQELNVWEMGNEFLHACNECVCSQDRIAPYHGQLGLSISGQYNGWDWRNKMLHTLLDAINKYQVHTQRHRSKVYAPAQPPSRSREVQEWTEHSHVLPRIARLSIYDSETHGFLAELQIEFSAEGVQNDNCADWIQKGSDYIASGLDGLVLGSGNVLNLSIENVCL